jgi:Holliday junction resolvase RusA-like endonuclease
MSVSIICACKNREKSLIISLNTWIMFPEVSEIIIVDWSSDVPINHLTSLDKRIKIVTVPNQKYFNQPQPLNLASDIASSDKLLKLDCDHILNPYYNFFEDYVLEENSCISGINHIKNDLYRGIFGLLYIRKKDFLRVNGFNEKMGKYYSFEDDEILGRLKLSGMSIKKIIPQSNRVIHLPHPYSKRVENFEGTYNNPEMEEYEQKIREDLSEKYDSDILDKKISVLLALEHNKKNRQIYGKVEDIVVKRLYEWNVNKIDSQNYTALPKL